MGFRAGLGAAAKRKTSLPLPGMEPGSPVTIPTELPQLPLKM